MKNYTIGFTSKNYTILLNLNPLLKKSSNATYRMW